MNRYEALKHAVKAHAGQKDRCGQDAILHPIAVAEAIPSSYPLPDQDQAWVWAYGGGQEEAKVIALLHDVQEDTDYVEHDPGLSVPEAFSLDDLTRKDGEPYFDYIDRCTRVPYSAIVKLADLWHNLQPERQACLPEKEQRSLEKRYLKAVGRIWCASGHAWWPEGGER